MLAENITAIVARNERFSGAAACEPYEAGWARAAVIFVRALKEPKQAQPMVRVEISPDGMRCAPEGAQAAMPSVKDGLVVLRVKARLHRATSSSTTGTEASDPPLA